MIINVSPSDFIIAANVGLRQAIKNLTRERKGGNSHPQDPVFDQAIFGAVAEFIVARLLNLFWDPHTEGNRKGDVGGIIEVRCRNPRSGIDIGIHLDELIEVPFVGVLHRGGFRFEITGWIYGTEAKQRGAWNDLRQCYYAQRPYRQLDELIELVRDLRCFDAVRAKVSM